MDYQPTAPADRCQTHDGVHAVYQGRCYAMGAQIPRRRHFRSRGVICQECGAEQDVERLEGGRVMLLTAGTDQRHHHPPRETPRVEIDEERLAAAIIAASRATREERREARAAASSAARPAANVSPRPTPPPPETEPAEPVAREIPTVTVWSPGPDDGAGQ